MTDYLLVDGYNIINAWDQLKQTARESLEFSRLELIDHLSEFQGVLWKRIIIVFDAHLSKGSQRHAEQIDGIMIIYTGEGETADSLIEGLVYELVDEGSVEVATSDWQEQRVIMGKGAIRLSARDLRNIILEAKAKMRKNFIEKNDGGKNTLGNLLDGQIRDKLNKFRHE